MAKQGFPYTVAVKAFEEYLAKAQKILGVPEKVDSKYLPTIGYGSSNHRAFIPVMKYVDLLDASGVPTERFRKGLRGNDPQIVGEGIKIGYSGLFGTYPDAHVQPTSVLATFMAAHSDMGDRALAAAVSTFQTVCKFGAFDAGSEGSTSPDAPGEDDYADRQAPISTTPRAGAPSGGTVNINVNIALSVDATSDAAVYDAFFAAMAKHIMVLGDGAGPANPS